MSRAGNWSWRAAGRLSCCGCRQWMCRCTWRRAAKWNIVIVASPFHLMILFIVPHCPTPSLSFIDPSVFGAAFATFTAV